MFDNIPHYSIYIHFTYLQPLRSKITHFSCSKVAFIRHIQIIQEEPTNLPLPLCLETPQLLFPVVFRSQP